MFFNFNYQLIPNRNWINILQNTIKNATEVYKKNIQKKIVEAFARKVEKIQFNFTNVSMLSVDVIYRNFRNS